MKTAPECGCGRTIVAMTVYAALCALFFAVRYSECYRSFRWSVALPAAFAAVATVSAARRGGIWIPLALAASAAGDVMGAQNMFFGQVGFFAVAHIFFICDFCRCMALSRRRLFGVAALAVPTFGYAAFVVGRAGQPAVGAAVAVYSVIIFGMAASAVMQKRTRYAWYVAAALLFVASDSMIAYGIAGGRIPNSTVWIMTSYYAAQGLFEWLHLMRRSRLD